MKILVIGATGGTGRATCEELSRRGHTVTAFARRAASADLGPAVRTEDGDATRLDDLRTAVDGQDAVVVTLGISEPPLRVRLRGASATPDDVRSRGTDRTVAAMQEAGVRRLVVLTSFGTGQTRDRLRLLDRAFFFLLIRQQMADTDRQDRVVRASGLEWTLVQPVHLHDGAATPASVSTSGEVTSTKVSRATVATVLADAATSSEQVHRSLTVSAA